MQPIHVYIPIYYNQFIYIYIPIILLSIRHFNIILYYYIYMYIYKYIYIYKRLCTQIYLKFYKIYKFLKFMPNILEMVFFNDIVN